MYRDVPDLGEHGAEIDRWIAPAFPDADETALAAKLSEIYGRSVSLKVDVDPAVLLELPDRLLGLGPEDAVDAQLHQLQHFLAADARTVERDDLGFEAAIRRAIALCRGPRLELELGGLRVGGPAPQPQVAAAPPVVSRSSTTNATASATTRTPASSQWLVTHTRTTTYACRTV